MSAHFVPKVLPLSRPASGGVYRSLEHWRGVAALWVMSFHCVNAQDGPTPPLLRWLEAPARPGWLGVHLFFVISGYCIAANVRSLRAKGLGGLDFLRDRVCRIVPTYWAALAVSILLSLAAIKFNHMTVAENLPEGFRGWLGDVLLIQPYLHTKPYVVVFWTLSVELGFYVLVALLFPVARFSERLAAGLALAVAVVGVWIPPSEMYHVLACWPEFVCGLLVFYAVRAREQQDRRQRLFCLGIIVGLGVLGGASTYSLGRPADGLNQLPFAGLFALVLYALYPLDEAINRLRGLRWLSFCGLFSYSLYLMHFPFGTRVHGIAIRLLPGGGLTDVLQIIVYIFVAVTSSYVFYRLFEARFERWRRRFKARPVLATA